VSDEEAKNALIFHPLSSQRCTCQTVAQRYKPSIASVLGGFWKC